MDEYQFMLTDPQETDPCENTCEEQGTSEQDAGSRPTQHPTSPAGEPTDLPPPISGIE